MYNALAAQRSTAQATARTAAQHAAVARVEARSIRSIRDREKSYLNSANAYNTCHKLLSQGERDEYLGYEYAELSEQELLESLRALHIALGQGLQLRSGGFYYGRSGQDNYVVSDGDFVSVATLYELLKCYVCTDLDQLDSLLTTVHYMVDPYQRNCNLLHLQEELESVGY